MIERFASAGKLVPGNYQPSEICGTDEHSMPYNVAWMRSNKMRVFMARFWRTGSPINTSSLAKTASKTSNKMLVGARRPDYYSITSRCTFQTCENWNVSALLVDLRPTWIVICLIGCIQYPSARLSRPLTRMRYYLPTVIVPPSDIH